MESFKQTCPEMNYPPRNKRLDRNAWNKFDAIKLIDRFANFLLVVKRWAEHKIKGSTTSFFVQRPEEVYYFAFCGDSSGDLAASSFSLHGYHPKASRPKCPVHSAPARCPVHPAPVGRPVQSAPSRPHLPPVVGNSLSVISECALLSSFSKASDCSSSAASRSRSFPAPPSPPACSRPSAGPPCPHQPTKKCPLQFHLYQHPLPGPFDCPHRSAPTHSHSLPTSTYCRWEDCGNHAKHPREATPAQCPPSTSKMIFAECPQCSTPWECVQSTECPIHATFSECINNFTSIEFPICSNSDEDIVVEFTPSEEYMLSKFCE